MENNESTGRRSEKAKKWAHDVKQRDGFKCRNCKSSERLHAHHIIPWKDSVELRFHLDNGKTLCISCHAKEELTGQKYSEERRKNISLSLMGQVSWSKGKVFSEEHRSRLSESHKGKPTWNKGKYTPPTSEKECRVCKETKTIESFTPQGKYRTGMCKMCRNSRLTKKRKEGKKWQQ